MTSKSKHYTPLERKLLLNFISEQKDIIEAKKSDASTLKMKKVAWEKITEKYNNSKEVVHTVSEIIFYFMNVLFLSHDERNKFPNYT